MQKIYCSNCGQLVQNKANFCQFCGAAQKGHESAKYRAAHAPVEHHKKTTKTHETISHEIIEKQHLAPRAVWVFLLNYFGKTIVMPLALGAGMFLEFELFALGLGFYFLLLILITILIYNNFVYTIDEDEFREEHGILFKVSVSIPYSQIQNVNIKRSILDRMLGLANISIETAGSSMIEKKETVGGAKTGAEGHLPGVSLKDAKKIHDILLQKAFEVKG